MIELTTAVAMICFLLPLVTQDGNRKFSKFLFRVEPNNLSTTYIMQPFAANTCQVVSVEIWFSKKYSFCAIYTPFAQPFWTFKSGRRFSPSYMGLPGFLGENRQIRSSYSEVYHRGSPEMGPAGVLGGDGCRLSKIAGERFDRRS